MEEIFSIAQSQYSALIICMLGLYMFWHERKSAERMQAEKDERREERQEKVNVLLEKQILDGIQKSHQQHVEIINMCKLTKSSVNDNIDNKSKLINQKIDLALKLGGNDESRN